MILRLCRRLSFASVKPTHQSTPSQRLANVRKGFLLLGVLLLIVTYLIWPLPRAYKKQSIDAAANVQTQGHQALSEAHSHQHTAHDRVEALSLAASSVPLLEASALHFSAPAMAAPELFAGGTTQVILDPSCRTRSTFKPDVAYTLEETLFREFGIRANARIPEGVPFEELTQFYRIGADYYQLSINTLPASRPPIYELSWYRAQDAQMRTQVARLAVPPSAGVLDITRASELFTQLLTTARINRAELGARLLNVRIPGASSAASTGGASSGASTGPNSDQELRFINGAPLQWVFGSGICQLASDTNRALCRCLPDGEQLRVPDV